MELTLRDLGQERYISLIGKRLVALQAAANGRYYAQNNTSPFNQVTAGRGRKTPRRIARYWTKNLNISDEESQRIADQLWLGPYGATIKAFAIVFAIHMMIPLMLAGTGAPPSVFLFLGMFFPALWGIIVGAMLMAPRQQLKQADERSLTVEEVETLLPTARGRLERQYFGLVMDALRTDIPTESAKSDIRAALRHLGDAISRLPADPVAAVDADALRREASGLRLQAARESDSFIEASLGRQADMLEQRAVLAAQNGRAARRMAMLRREARTQMDGLRSVLVGFAQTPQMDSASVNQLSAALHRVAGEAKAVALAHQELAEEELGRMYGGPLPTPQAIPVATPQALTQTVTPNGSGPVPVATPPAVPTNSKDPAASRHWWTGNGTP